MRRSRLLWRNLCFYWRGNLAVLLGVTVGTAVLTGALVVGDSLRGSLRELTLARLGWVDGALLGSRFIRTELAAALPAERVSPALVLNATVTAGDTATNRVVVYGVDSRFWAGAPPVDDDFWKSDRAEVVINQSLADKLRVGPAGAVTLCVQKASAVPRESLLGRRDGTDVVEKIPLRVAAIVTNTDNGDFSLNPSPAAPLNAFVPLRFLQEKLGQRDRVNTLLAGGVVDVPALQAAFARQLTLDDWGLRLHSPTSRTDDLLTRFDSNHDGRLSRSEYRGRIAEMLTNALTTSNGTITRDSSLEHYRRRGLLTLESRQLLLDANVAEAALAAARETGLLPGPTLVYMANGISDGTNEIPYSLVAALDSAAQAPLGPFLPNGSAPLGDDDIVLVDWKDSPLKVKPGSPITLRYFEPEEQGGLVEKTSIFTLRGSIPLDGVAADPDLTPAFPGITDQLSMDNWEAPFPLDRASIKPRDDDFWKRYRTTPKAYISLAAGQKIWGSRFGNVTSIRLAADSPGRDLTHLATEYSRSLLSHLQPERGGLVFDPVRARALDASSKGTDFGELFLAFSFFLIVAALLLVGLLVRLNLDRRAAEVGLLLATGFRRGALHRLLLSEGAVVTTLGAAVGLLVAVGYAAGLLALLRAWWPGELSGSFLHLFVNWRSLAVGYVAALVVSVVTIGWTVRALGSVSPSALLAGATTAPHYSATPRRRWSRWIAGVSLTIALLLCVLGSFLQDSEQKSGAFFGSGFLFLTAGLSATLAVFRGGTPTNSDSGQTPFQSGPLPALRGLSIRNAARHPTRSLLTAGLLAAAAFLLVAVESFRPRPERDFLSKHSGSGGFTLLAEADVPIYQDLNSSKGRDELFDQIERGQSKEKRAEAEALLKPVDVFALRLRAGDDASCLNLYQPKRPRVLGVPNRLIERGGFKFQSTEATTAEDRANPWRLLEHAHGDGPIPVFGEANTVQYQLHSGIGKSLMIPDENGKDVEVRIVGLLQDSVFQSELVLAESNFLRLYPRQEGFTFFLIDTGPEAPDRVAKVLESGLAGRGWLATPSADRLQSFLAVESMYLSTFQALGGMGLLLGALGLSVVLLRTVWERRAELALLRALGFRHSALRHLILAENGFLLLLGLGIGTLAALVAVAPHLLESGGSVPWPKLVLLLGVVLLIGLTTAALAVTATLRAALVPALRRE